MAMSAIALLLSGCASGPAIDYIRAEYSGSTTLQTHRFAEEDYRIFDKAEASKLMITPSMNTAVNMGVANGLTYGAADQSAFTKPYSDAAASYLASTGRTCRILSTELLAKPQYEVKYDCSAPPTKRGATKRS